VAGARRRPIIQPTQGASYGISQFFFLFLQQIVVLREVEPRPGRQQGRQGEHPEQPGAKRACQRQGQEQQQQPRSSKSSSK
jgi:hypothetical protein